MSEETFVVCVAPGRGSLSFVYGKVYLMTGTI